MALSTAGTLGNRFQGSVVPPGEGSAPRQVVARAEAAGGTVLVTGASGRTGKLVAQKIKASEDLTLRALVRSEQGKEKLQKDLQLADSEVVVADVVNSDKLVAAAEGATAMIVATSAKPQLVWSSMPGFFWKKFVTKEEGARPLFTFPQMPEEVDWIGQKKQFDAAKATGVKHVVLVSSMGGTQPDNALNKLGDGNILVWKRKAEQYLVSLGMTYTIIHPGGLKDSAGGQAGLVVDVDDKLLERKARSISRADVAELSVQSLRMDAAKNRSIDVINDSNVIPITSTAEFNDLLTAMPGNCDYSINPAP